MTPVLLALCISPFSGHLWSNDSVSVPRPLPSSFSVCWGAGSRTGESAGQDIAGNRQPRRKTGERGGCDRMSPRRELWEERCTSASPAFYLIVIGNSESLFLIKAQIELRCSECSRKKKNLGEGALVYSQLFINAVFVQHVSGVERGRGQPASRGPALICL